MKLLILFAFISTLVISAYGQDLSCAELEQQGENGIRKLLIIEEGATIPQTAEELETRCNDGKKLYKNFLEYKKCLKPFPQTVFQTATQSIGKLLKKNCGTEEGKKTALKLLQCANADRIKMGQQCAVGSLDAIQKLSETNDSKATIVPKVCCLAHVSADCARTKLGQITCEDPTIKPLEQFEEVLAVLTKDTMELACEDYKTMAACQAKIPDAVAQMQQIVNTASNSFGGRSLIKPLLAIADKMAN